LLDVDVALNQKRIAMNVFMREIVEAAKESPRLFFAPLVGAIEAVRREMNHLANGGQHKPGSACSRTTTDDRR
jgi:hypothetical protein